MLLVYLIYSSHNVIQFVILENDMDELGFRNRLQLLMGTIELSGVARLINWVIFTIILMHIDFLIELAKLHIVLLIVKFAYVKSQAAMIFSSRKNFDETLTLLICNINLISVQKGHKIVHINHTLIVRVREFSDLLDELLPIRFYLLEYFFIYSNAIVLLHFKMKLAKVVPPEHSLPALRMLAIFLSIFFMRTHRGLSSFSRRSSWRSTLETMVRIVLSEVETLCWVNLTSNGHLEVLIRYLAIFIQIKFIKEHLELCLCYSTKPPMLKVEP